MNRLLNELNEKGFHLLSRNKLSHGWNPSQLINRSFIRRVHTRKDRELRYVRSLVCRRAYEASAQLPSGIGGRLSSRRAISTCPLWAVKASVKTLTLSHRPQSTPQTVVALDKPQTTKHSSKGRFYPTSLSFHHISTVFLDIIRLYVYYIKERRGFN